MNITVVGHVCIDNNISENVTYTSAGSPAMFMVKVYKKFPKVSVNIIAPYGSDFLTYLRNINIYPKKPTAEKTLISDFPLDYVENFITPAKKAPVKIFIPQGYYRDFDKDDNVIQRDFREAEKIIPLFDFVIVSDQDHKDINNIAKSWAKRTNVIITMGDKGAKHLYRDDSISVSVDPVKSEDIVDSVGSGDIFSASFGYKYLLTKNVKKSLKFANSIARQCLFYPSNNLQFTLPN